MPAVQFTVFGKVILLILIQIGGLGVIACVTGFFIIFKKKNHSAGAGDYSGEL